MRGILRELSAAGDTVLAEWDTENAVEVESAKEAIEKLIREGKAVMATNGHAGVATRVSELDPAAHSELIAVRPLQGG